MTDQLGAFWGTRSEYTELSTIAPSGKNGQDVNRYNALKIWIFFKKRKKKKTCMRECVCLCGFITQKYAFICCSRCWLKFNLHLRYMSHWHQIITFFTANYETANIYDKTWYFYWKINKSGICNDFQRADQVVIQNVIKKTLVICAKVCVIQMHELNLEFHRMNFKSPFCKKKPQKTREDKHRETLHRTYR